MNEKDSDASSNSTIVKRQLKNDHILTVLICAISIPLSMSMWIVNIVYSKYVMSHEGLDEPVVISPARWLASCFIPITIAVYGYRKKSVNLSGAALGIVVAFVLTLSNYCFLAALFTFFLSSSKATKFRGHLKKKIEEDFKEGGQRNWIQVLCNGGMATQLGLLYLLDVGASERPIDFVKDYRASWLSLGVLGVFACCNGDTWASELGTVLSKSDPFLVTTWETVPKGTNGGITVIGTVFSTIGGLVIGLSQYLAVIYFTDDNVLMYAPPQWPIILFGAMAGFIGSLIDSLMGATLQYSGVDKDGKIVSHPSSQAVKHISGHSILDNHSVNLISTVIMGLLMPTISVFACCNGDTWASELGTVLSKSDPFLVTTWETVPKGTNGGITVIGTVFSTIGGLVIGLSQYLAVIYFTDDNVLMYAPPQWPIILFGAMAGFIGSLIDSLMGATLQYSGVDKDGKIVSHPSSQTVKHISGHIILDNHSVNLISTVIMGLLKPTISKTLWSLFM